MASYGMDYNDPNMLALSAGEAPSIRLVGATPGPPGQPRWASPWVTSTPLADAASGVVGVSLAFARADHQHPITTLPITITTGFAITAAHAGLDLHFTGASGNVTIASAVLVPGFYCTVWCDSTTGVGTVTTTGTLIRGDGSASAITHLGRGSCIIIRGSLTAGVGFVNGGMIA